MRPYRMSGHHSRRDLCRISSRRNPATGGDVNYIPPGLVFAVAFSPTLLGQRPCQTFAFAIVPVSLEQISLNGSVVNAAGKLQPDAEVDLIEGRVLHRTSNAKGEFARSYGVVAKWAALVVVELPPI
jgi:hypothetical protein